MNIPLSEDEKLEGFNLSNLSPVFLAVVTQTAADEQAMREQAASAPVTIRNVSNVDGGIIAKFNASISIEDALMNTGKYTRQRNGLYLFNGSTSGIPGGVIFNRRFYTHHQSDTVLCTGHALDPFDIFCLTVHGGDSRKAVAAAADMVDPEGQKARRLEFKKQDMLTTCTRTRERFTGQI